MTGLPGRLVILVTLVVLLRPAPTREFRILFIGNSLTAANGLPDMVQAMGKASGQGIRVASTALPNFSLEDHLQQGDAARAIERGGWTHVVLQQGPSALPDSRVQLVRDVKRFDALIRAHGGRTCVFMVWPSSMRAFDFDGVVASYTEAARAADAILIPAGSAWRAAWTEDRALELYAADGFHPSPLGSELAAMTVYHRLIGALPAHPPGELVRGATRDIFRRAVLVAR